MTKRSISGRGLGMIAVHVSRSCVVHDAVHVGGSCVDATRDPRIRQCDADDPRGQRRWATRTGTCIQCRGAATWAFARSTRESTEWRFGSAMWRSNLAIVVGRSRTTTTLIARDLCVYRRLSGLSGPRGRSRSADGTVTVRITPARRPAARWTSRCPAHGAVRLVQLAASGKSCPSRAGDRDSQNTCRRGDVTSRPTWAVRSNHTSDIAAWRCVGSCAVLVRRVGA